MEGVQPPVILQVLPSLYSGGVERGTVDIASAISTLGWVSIVASGGGPMMHDITRAGATHITLGLNTRNPLFFQRNSRALIKIIRERGVNLIHARSRAPAWSCIRAARITGIPLVTTFHGTYSSDNVFKRKYNSVMLKGNRVIAISNFIADHIVNTYQHFDSSKLITIPRGVDLDSFDPALISGSRIIELAKKWRLPDGVPIIMMPGRLARWKGHVVLIEALAKMENTNNLCMILGRSKGNESYRREIEKLARSFNLETRIRFVDHESDMPAAYMLADVVVSASTNPEAFGRVTAEAQAMGRPVIASGHGGSRETLLPGKTGWLVKPGDPLALASAIDEALGIDGWKREVLAARASRHVAKNFSLSGMCDATLKVYSDLLKEAANKE